MLDLSKRPPNSWRSAAIPKKDGSLRYLLIPNDELKEVQEQILQHLYSCKLKIHPAACGFRPFKSTLDGVLRHDRKAKVIVNMDVHSFFPSFPVEEVRTALIENNIPYADTDYIMEMCVFKGKRNSQLPQGAPTSPYLTNIGMFKIDCIVNSLAEEFGFTYSRYADDLTFASVEGVEENIKGIIQSVKTVFSEKLNGMRFSDKKTNVIYLNSPRAARRITGVTVRKDGLGYGAPSKFRKDTRAAVHNLYTKLKEGALPENLKKVYKETIGRVQYCDLLRSLNDEGANMGDPKIEKEKLNYIMRRFKDVC